MSDLIIRKMRAGRRSSTVIASTVSSGVFIFLSVTMVTVFFKQWNFSKGVLYYTMTNKNKMRKIKP